MRLKTRICFSGFVLLLGVLMLVLLGGLRDLGNAAEGNSLTVDRILEQVENKYANSKFSANFIQKSTIKAMDITDMATGKVYIKYPGMMRWEYEKVSFEPGGKGTAAYLSEFRGLDAFLHVIRGFEDEGVPHVFDGADPARALDLPGPVCPGWLADF